MTRNLRISVVVGVLGLAALLIVVGAVRAQDDGPITVTPPPVEGGDSGGNGPDQIDAVLGSAITYQGQLKQNGAPFTGNCDMGFRLYDALAAGTQVGSAVSTTVAATNGLFTVNLNFGTTPFEGDARYLDITLRCPSGSGAYAVLTPRQSIAAAPYALSLRPGATISATTSGNVLNVENYGGTSGRAAYFRNSGGSTSATVRMDNEGNSWGLYATSDGGTAVEGVSTQDIGVIGRHNATTGTLPAMAGYSASTSTSAIGVLGQINSTAPGGSSAGVRGINNGTAGSGIGVWGSQEGSGWGVYGEAPTGRGVYGLSSDGTGVQGSSTTGIGVYASSNGIGVSNPAVYAVNSHAGAEPNGIAIYAQNASGDATIVARNTSTGDTFRSLNAAGTSVIYRVTSTGRVVASAVQIYGGGDLAEKFEVNDAKSIEPGTLLVIDPDRPGELTISTTAYDSKVAGVVSGAQGVNPGLTLHQDEVLDGDAVVAIAGRVYVKADATYGAIKPGDLLTTSDTPGHAMKASQREKSHGAVIGKAMTGLARGTGYVLVLINLQ